MICNYWAPTPWSWDGAYMLWVNALQMMLIKSIPYSSMSITCIQIEPIIITEESRVPFHSGSVMVSLVAQPEAHKISVLLQADGSQWSLLTQVQHVLGFLPWGCLSGHHYLHNASILMCICITQLSRTWSTSIRMFHRPHWKPHTTDTLRSTCSAICWYIHPVSLRHTMQSRSNGWNCSTGYILIG